MALANLKNRIRKAQRNTHAGEALGRIAELISRGAFYDELTPEEKEAYKQYKESLGGVADDIAWAYLQTVFFKKTEEEAYHFPLTKRKKPPTEEELAKREQEIELYMQEKIDEEGL